jgi:hypothetical protein
MNGRYENIKRSLPGNMKRKKSYPDGHSCNSGKAEARRDKFQCLIVMKLIHFKLLSDAA